MKRSASRIVAEFLVSSLLFVLVPFGLCWMSLGILSMGEEVSWIVVAIVFLVPCALIIGLMHLADRRFRVSLIGTLALAVIAVTLKMWGVTRMERKADESLASLLETLGTPQFRAEALFPDRPPVAETDDPIAALDENTLEADQQSFSEFLKRLSPADDRFIPPPSRLHPFSSEELEAIDSWFTTHTNFVAAADAVSASPDYRSCLPGPTSFEGTVTNVSFLIPDPRLVIADGILYAKLVVLRAQAAIAAGDGTACASAVAPLENLAFQYERVPILVNSVCASGIRRMEFPLLVPRIDLWSEADLLAVQRRADEAVATAESRFRVTLAHEMLFIREYLRSIVKERYPFFLQRVSGAPDFWIAAECRALFENEADFWKAARPLFKTAPDEILGDRLDSLGKDETERTRSLPPLARTTIPALSSVIVSQTVGTRNRAAFVRTAVAVERYRRARGALPPSLDALIPEFLPAVPVDARSGAPIAYLPGPVEIPEETFPTLDDSGPATRILPAQTLPGFRLTLPDGTRKKNPRNIDHFFFIPDAVSADSAPRPVS